MEKSPFVRYVKGNKIIPENNIQEIFRIILKNVRKQSELVKYLKSEIKNFNDGIHYGISLESTWYKFVLEVFENLKIDEKIEFDFLEILKILTKKIWSRKKKWGKLKGFLMENLDILSAYDRRCHLDFFGGEIIRGKNGKYYVKQNGKITSQIYGAKTELEEKFNCLSTDAKSSYGRTYSILKLIALYFIFKDFKKDSRQYPDSMICILPEGDSGTNFLFWHWSREDPYRTRDVDWRPLDVHCDPNWLADDLIASYCDKHNLPSETKPIADESEFDKKAWDEAFNPFSGQYEVALDTYLILGKKCEAYLEFEHRKIRWINGNEYLAPVIIIPVKDMDNYEEERALTNRFLSHLSFRFRVPMKIIATIGSPKKFRPLLLQSRHFGGIIYNPPYFIPIKTTTEEQKLALALSREGSNADSAMYAFLNFYKIITLVSGEKKVDDWIEKHLDPKIIYGLDEWKQKYLKTNKPGKFLRHITRDAIAHIGELGKLRTGHPIINPDYIPQIESVRASLGIVQSLAKIALKEILPLDPKDEAF
ncbi:hypothetical protein KKA15_06865 [Patescibacteria group bacterium]|nr:hypothetical protein [Patescibacteria group bacterium]